MPFDQGHEENTRKCYRIIYPVSCRPVLKIENNKYPVIDISERGIQFLCRKYREFKPDTEIKFSITFNNATSIELRGKILRVEVISAAVSLSTPIPMEIILEEQRYLRENYPDEFKE